MITLLGRMSWVVGVSLSAFQIYYATPFWPATFLLKKQLIWGFPGGAVVENLPANAGDTGSSLGLGRSHMPWSN